MTSIFNHCSTDDVIMYLSFRDCGNYLCIIDCVAQEDIHGRQA